MTSAGRLSITWIGTERVAYRWRSLLRSCSSVSAARCDWSCTPKPRGCSKRRPSSSKRRRLTSSSSFHSAKSWSKWRVQSKAASSSINSSTSWGNSDVRSMKTKLRTCAETSSQFRVTSSSIPFTWLLRICLERAEGSLTRAKQIGWNDYS